MRLIPTVVAGAVALGAGNGAVAQYVKGNEAVRLMADGAKQVQTPPIPSAGLPPPCPAQKPGCAASGSRMVETTVGLQECTEIYARPGTCRASTYGTEKRSRLWIVKSGGQWMQCQRPDLASRCVSTKALPFGEVQ